ncbi:hypothetical protein [Georgenia sp. H159]|uniref:hypothetical protein n=1 Tax=Georgenia sp. H159 TaxID=3076115 RepID=UPI002D76E9A9|nr:hypothetical protein [Georgenia sp. H159]
MIFLLAGCATGPAVDEPLATSEPTSADLPSSTPSDSQLEVTSVCDALESRQPGEEVRVRAALVTENDVPFLCDSVEDSDPEQCSEPSVEIIGAPLADLGLRERRSELAGEVDIVITLDDDVATFVRTAGDT